MRLNTRTRGQLVTIAPCLLTSATPYGHATGPASDRQEDSGPAVDVVVWTTARQAYVTTPDTARSLARPTRDIGVAPSRRRAGR